jgi:glyceraldehyde 3-phosphate dehydrogenase
MALTVGISGMGRIGRLVVRHMIANPRPGCELKVINASYPSETIAHLLKYDTVHGTWDVRIEVPDPHHLVINGQTIRLVAERVPADIGWGKYGVDLVVDATGKFNNREGASGHLVGGASHVLITAPGERMDLTVVMGVNDHLYDPKRHRLISAASCTTNCLAPVLHVLDRAFKVQSGWMTTVHAYTSDQRILDNPHKDLRRARSCANSIVPTSTGVRKALAEVLPHLAPRFEGMALRVPVQDVSAVDLTVKVAGPVTLERVKDVFRQAAEGEMAPYLGYSEEPLVSSDYIGNPKSAVIDALSLKVMDDQIKVLAWYDNEWAYASRVAELVRLTAERIEQQQSAAQSATA